MVCVHPQRPEPEIIQEAAAVLRRGGFVIFPTETVYGLGVNLQDPQAIQELYQIKRRPFEKKVTLHIAQIRQVVAAGVRVSESARRLMRRFWPGPLTLVLPRPDGSSVGFRMPQHPVALALLQAAQIPVGAASVNLSGAPPACTAQEAMLDFAEKVDLVLDAGPTPGGVASTVVDCSVQPPRILRRGARVSDIEQAISALTR